MQLEFGNLDELLSHIAHGLGAEWKIALESDCSSHVWIRRRLGVTWALLRSEWRAICKS